MKINFKNTSKPLRAVKIISILLIMTLLCQTAALASNESGTAEYILSGAPSPKCASVGGEWGLIGIVRGGYAPSGYTDEYLANLKNTLDESGGDLGRKYTEYSRIAIALNTLGIDAHDFGGYDLFGRINDYDAVVRQGINGAIFALEAKRLCGDDDTETENKYIDYIIGRQDSDGSFCLSEGTPDTDITAMAISALCLCDETDAVTRAINRAFLYLSRVQLSNGAFSENIGGEANCESTAQVVIAMRAYGLAADDKFFVKNGNTAEAALELFICSDGGSSHLIGGESNLMSTEQTLLAVTGTRHETRTLIYDRIWFEARNGI